jgi:pimeloyl-ACP methyl ester carboxylesterase
MLALERGDRTMTPWLLGGVAAYAIAVGGLWLAQDGLVFPTAATVRRGDEPPPREAVVRTLSTPDGERVQGWVLRRSHARGLVLGFQGNAWHGDDFFNFLAHRLPDHHVAVFHYRGYAPSTGRPSEAALIADALLIHDRLRDELRPPRVIAAGFSLGSGVAAQLAAQRSIDGALLVTPFDSIEAIARRRYPWVPVRPLLAHPFRSDRALTGREVPVAVIAAGADRVVPPEHTRALEAALARLVFSHTLPDASHQDLYDRPEFQTVLERAIEAIHRARATEVSAEILSDERPRS